MNKKSELRVKKTRNGKGVFALKDLRSDQLIFPIKGKVVNWKISIKLPQKNIDNSIRISAENYLLADGYLTEFINHSCLPNTAITKIGRKLFLKAIAPIKKGSELVFDYSTVLAADDIWTMQCNCGEKECRKIIKKFKTLPKDLRQEYIAKKIVPEYVLKI
jgi:SET domain-containing protein